jgi:hypothetical protein
MGNNPVTQENRWIQVGVANKGGGAVSRERQALVDIFEYGGIMAEFQAYKTR